LGVVLANSPGGVELLYKDDETVAVRTADFTQLTRVPVPAPRIASASGRLLAASHATQSGELRAQWSNRRVLQGAIATATVSVASRRGALPDWLELGVSPELLQLTPSEVLWAQALRATRRREATAALQFLELLPASSYSEKVVLLLKFLPSLSADADLCRRSRLLVGALDPEDARVEAIATALSPSLPPQAYVTAARHLLGQPPQIPGGTRDTFLRAVGAFDRDTIVETTTLSSLPSTRLLVAYTNALGGVTSDPPALASLTLPLLDDLVDAGVVTSQLVSSVATHTPAQLLYLRARSNPSDLSDDQLRDVGHTAELARRAYLANDRDALAGLPQTDEDVGHYLALSRLRSGGPLRSDGLRPNVAKAVQQLRDFLSEVHEGHQAPVPSAVLDDRTCWRLLDKEARAGRVNLSDEQRDAYPDFASLLDIFALQACLWAQDWGAATDLSSALLKTTVAEPVKAEALNISAYAKYQLGHPKKALSLSQAALDQQPENESFLINLGILASEVDPNLAVHIYNRLYRATTDQSLRLAVLRKSINLWAAHSPKQSLADLNANVREMLGTQLGDDDLTALLQHVLFHDTEWLASPPKLSHYSGESSQLIAYYVTLARHFSPNYSGQVSDLVDSLVNAHRRDPVPKWAAHELMSFIGLLTGGLEADLGEAAWVAPPVRTLINAALLSPVQVFVLAPRAGSHLAGFLYDQGGPGNRVLSIPDEKLFLIDPILGYCRGVSTDATTEIGNVIAGSLAIAGICLFQVASEWMQGANDYLVTLVNELQWNFAGRSRLINNARSVGNDIKDWIARGELYCNLLVLLPLEDMHLQTLGQWQYQVETWKSVLTEFGLSA
jgi:hypothetical protein